MLVGVFAGLRLKGIEGPKVKLLQQLLENMHINRLSCATFVDDGRSSARRSLLQTGVEVAGHNQGMPTGTY